MIQNDIIKFFFFRQSLCTVVEDLQMLQRKVYFWHWSKEPMGVLCRLNSKMFALFKDAQTEDELVKSISVPAVHADDVIAIVYPPLKETIENGKQITSDRFFTNDT